MPIDASIYSLTPQYKAPDQLNALAKVMQVKALQQDQEVGQMKMDAYRRQVEEQNALRNALSAPDADPYNALLKLGRVKEATDFAEGRAKIARENVASQKDAQETKAKQFQFMANVLNEVKDQAGYDRAVQLASMFGMDTKGIPAEYNPQLVQQFAGAFTTQAQKWADQRAREQQAETARHNQATEKTAAGQLAVAQGNLGLRRQELEFNKSQPRGQIVETEGGFMLADPRGGTAQPLLGPDGQQLKGKAANRQLTEGQGKSTAFAMRAIEAENQLEGMGAYNPSLKDRAALAVPFDLARGAASDQSQKYDTAKRNFIASVLRKETGAAVTKPEFEMYDKMYFPQVGDSPEVLADKKRQRTLALEGLMAEAGPGREVVDRNVKRAAAAPAPAAGGGLTPEEQKELEALRARFGKGK